MHGRCKKKWLNKGGGVGRGVDELRGFKCTKRDENYA